MGVQAYYFGKKDFELGVGGEDQDTSRHFEGRFGSIRAILSMWGLREKNGARTKIWTKGNRAYLLSPFEWSLKKEHFRKNNVKIGWKWPSYAKFNVHAPKWHLAYFVPIDDHFGHFFWDMNFKFVLPFIYINFDIQVWSQLDPNWPFYPPKKLQKNSKTAISQNPILPKCHSPKSLLLLHFSMNLFETFRINVNMDFAFGWFLI